MGQNIIRKVNNHLDFLSYSLSKAHAFSYGEVSLRQLFHCLLVLTAELVSLYFAVRWREWSHYYYQVVVWDEKEGDADSRKGLHKACRGVP